MRNRAFSLIEVIVSLAIIAVVSALLLPVFSSARAKAKEVGCIANMRQLGLAMEMYKSDNGEYPSPQDDIDPYVKAKLKCSADKSPGYNFGSYGNTAFIWKSVPAFHFPDVFERLMECREKRGSEYPLLVDKNHLPKLLRADDILPGFALVYRINGAVQRIDKKRAAQVFEAKVFGTRFPEPCDPRLSFANL